MHVLLVDDDRGAREHAARSLRDAGFEVREAADGAEALLEVDGAPPALIIADLHMPRLDGRALLGALKARHETASIPFVLLSGETDPSLRVACLEGGAADVLAKPIDSQELAARARLQLRTARAMARLRTQSEIDELTEVLNRRGLMRAIERERAHAERSREALALLLVDVDRFKSINDAHGHLVGDAVLRDIAALLCASVRGCDTVGRLGGDEFVVLLPGAGADEAAEIARRIRARAGALRVAGTDRTIGLSIGIARGDGADLLHTADRAMYADKAGGALPQ